MPGTPGGSHMQGPQGGPQMHHQDFHHPSPQHGHMGMHSSPTKMHPTGGASGGSTGHHGHSGAPFHWSHGADMPMGAASGARGENMPIDSSGLYCNFSLEAAK